MIISIYNYNYVNIYSEIHNSEIHINIMMETTNSQFNLI